MPRLPSQTIKTFLLVALPMSVGVLLALFLVYRSWFTQQSQRLEQEQLETLEQVIAIINRELGHVRNLTIFVKNSLMVKQALDASKPIDRAILAKQFVNYGSSTNMLTQLRWLNMQGKEIVRINVHDNHVNVVPSAQLQDKGDRYYFQNALYTLPGEVYLSSIDLNIENQRIVVPFEPTIRSAIRTGDEDHLHEGMIILNFGLHRIFERIRQLSRPDMSVQLVNKKGYWLIHPVSSNEWGDQLGHDDDNVEHQNMVLWQNILQDEHQVGLLLHGDLWSYSKISIGTGQPNSKNQEYLYVIVATTDRQLNILMYRILWPLVSVGILCFLCIFYLSYRYTKSVERNFQLSRSLAKEKWDLEQSNFNLQQSKSQMERLQNRLIESRKLSSLGMIIAGVAHELNTPTGGALVSVSSLQERVKKFKILLAQGITRNQLNELITSFEEGLSLSIHNLEQVTVLIEKFKNTVSEPHQYTVEHFYLGEQVKILLQTISSANRSNLVKFEVDIDPKIKIATYPGILSQVLKNIVENALEHGYRNDESGTIQVKATIMDPESIQIDIYDNGQGIADPEVAKQLFDPFVTTARGRGHTGLGLYFVYQWVTHLLAGTISYSTTVGYGTTFTIVLPLQHQDQII
ncbi:sensor histidine kinase [Celerinatantimonas sp. YJH-8]|uniref:sensor histidine kinase n=1 Tax=Celerinatantimonas sp. YJH-8 TaxID=3228714 RepID=UPI0038CADAAD